MSSSFSRRVKRAQTSAKVQETLANSSVALAIYNALCGPIPESIQDEVRAGLKTTNTLDDVQKIINDAVATYRSTE